MVMKLDILFVEDSAADQLLAERQLRKDGLEFECRRVIDDDELVHALQSNWHVVLCDYHVPGMAVQRTLGTIRSRHPDMPVILVSGSIGEERAIELLHAGFSDFILKDNLLRLAPAIWRCLQAQEDRRARIQSELALQASESRFRAYFTHAPIMLAVVDAHSRILDANPRFQLILGYDLVHLQNMPLIALCDEADCEHLTRDIAQLQPGRQVNGDYRFRCKNGELRWVSLRISQIDHGERLIYARDITEVRKVEARLRLMAGVFDATQEGVAITDLNGAVLAVNPAFTTITEYSEADVLGRSLNMLSSGRHTPDFYQDLWHSLREQGYWQSEIWNRRKSGEIYPQWLTISAVQNEHGTPERFVGVFTDISRIKHSTTHLEHLAHHDALTDLPNRLLLTPTIKQAIQRARRNGSRSAVLFFDLDKFKAVNDTYGHAAGDLLLQEVAQRVRARLREADMLARLGGDEFVILMEELPDTQHAADLAQTLIDLLSEPFDLRDGPFVRIGCSIGIALFPQDGGSVAELLENADAALYQVKRNGRNHYQFHSPPPAMTGSCRILVIEDNEADFLLLIRYLRQHDLHCTLTRVDNDAALEDALRQSWDMVLSDYNVPGMDFSASLQRIRQHDPNLPLILVSGTLGEEKAVDLFRLGVSDFVFKDNPARLAHAVQRAQQDVRLAREQQRNAHQHQALEAERKAADHRARLAMLNQMEDLVARRGELQASETKFRLLAEFSSDWIFWRHPDGRYHYVSPACGKICGHPASAFMDDPDLMQTLLHPDDRARYLRHLENETSEDPAEMEFRVRHRDGDWRWIAHFCQPIYDTQHRFLGRRGSNRDITQHKQAQEIRLLYSEALRQAAQPVLLADPEGRISHLNAAFSALFGYSPADLQGLPVSRLAPDSPAARDQQAAILRTLQSGQTWSGELERVARDGRLIPTAAAVAPIFDDNGKLLGFIASYLDLRPLRESELKLRKLTLAVEQSPESIVITDLDAHIEYVNEAFCRNTGYRAEEVIGKNPNLLHSGKTPLETYQSLWATLLKGETWSGDFYNRRKDGSEYTEHALIGPLRQADGRITHYVAVKEDITARRAAEAKIHQLAHFDPLTGLPNRALLLDHLAQALLQIGHNGHQGGLLLFNLDRFSRVNDAGGQELGDALLRAAAGRLSALAHRGDIVAHIAGDEFGLLLMDLPPPQSAAVQHAKSLAQRIHDALREPFLLGIERIMATACIGIALFPDTDRDTPLDILRRANAALHHAKEQGSAHTTFFEDSLDELTRQRFETERELHQALAEKQLRVYLQPQVSDSGTPLGAEALVRWQHPARGLVPPAAFIPIAEESNLVTDIGRWMLDEVCALLAREAVRTLPLRIAVNISPRHFSQPDFVQQVELALTRSGADPTHLTLEVTEGLVIDNLNGVISKMNTLRRLGIHFSLDDFGTGYSSLSYLKQLPINEIKIDKSFVTDLDQDSGNAALVETILLVARHMRLKVVAEGVETESQADFLRQRGGVIFQGYLFGRPEPADVVLQRFIGRL